MDEQGSNLWFEGPLREETRHLTRSSVRVARIPKRYWSCRLDLIPDHAYHKRRVDTFAHHLTDHIRDGRGLVLYGEFGRGKTGTGVCLLKKAMAHGAYGLFVRALDLPEIEKDRSDQGRELRQRVRRQQVLMVDDLGASRENDFGQAHEILVKILRHRYDNQLMTMITTNLTPAKLSQALPSMKTIFASDYEHVICKGHDWREV